jgi:hypothetical protein
MSAAPPSTHDPDVRRPAGVAQLAASDYLRSSAYTKGRADRGPGGQGAIYRTNSEIDAT